MKRDEAKQLVRKAHFNIEDPNKMGELAVDKIYDDFESRTCENCKHNTYEAEFKHNCDHDDVFDSYEGECLIPYDFSCNRWEKV